MSHRPLIGRRRLGRLALVWELLGPHSEASWLVRVVPPGAASDGDAVVALPFAWGLPVRLHDQGGPLVFAGDWLEWDAERGRWIVVESELAWYVAGEA